MDHFVNLAREATSSGRTCIHTFGLSRIPPADISGGRGCEGLNIYLGEGSLFGFCLPRKQTALSVLDNILEVRFPDGSHGRVALGSLGRFICGDCVKERMM